MSQEIQKQEIQTQETKMQDIQVDEAEEKQVPDMQARDAEEKQAQDMQVREAEEKHMPDMQAHDAQKQEKSTREIIQGLLENVEELTQTIIYYIVLVYMVLLGGVLPLYFEEGYAHIATDKASLFCKVSVHLWKIIIPVLIVYAIAASAVKFAKSKKTVQESTKIERFQKTFCRIYVTDFFALVYAVASIISFLCSDYRDSALWGEKGWYMGLIPQLFLVGVYFLISRFWEPKEISLGLLFAVSAVVFGLGYINRFGYYPFEMEYSSWMYISTIGNVNWFCGYAVTVFFVGVACYWLGIGKKRWQRGLLAAYVWLGFGTLVVQGSAGGIVTVGAMFLIFFCMSAESARRMRKFWSLMVLFSLACLFAGVVRRLFPDAITFHDGYIDLLTLGILPIIMTVVSGVFLALTFRAEKEKIYPAKTVKKWVIGIMTVVSIGVLVIILMIAVNTRQPGSLGKLSEYEFFTFSSTWGSYRGSTWPAGILCFWEQDLLHKLVGVGPDAMSAYIKADAGELLNAVVQKHFAHLRLTNAHNEWLTVLIDLGVLGLVGFAGMILSAITTFLRSGTVKRVPTGKKRRRIRDTIPTACAFGIIAYTINNMFSFQQTMNMTALILVMGIGMAFERNKL